MPRPKVLLQSVQSKVGFRVQYNLDELFQARLNQFNQNFDNLNRNVDEKVGLLSSKLRINDGRVNKIDTYLDSQCTVKIEKRNKKIPNTGF